MEPDNPPCLVLVPGLACDGAVWAPVLPSLAPLCQPWVPPPEVLPSLPAMAQAVLDAAPAERFALAGHSLGGRVALEVMRRAPQRVLRLALLDTGCAPLPAGPAGQAEADQRLALVALARREGMRAMAERWAPPMLHPAHRDQPVYGAVLAMLARQSVDRFEAQQHALLARPDATEVLGTVAVPTLLLCGEQDTWSPPDRHREMAGRVSGARLSLVPDCGHMSPMEQPGAVAQVLRGWLHGAG